MIDDIDGQRFMVRQHRRNRRQPVSALNDEQTKSVNAHFEDDTSAMKRK